MQRDKVYARLKGKCAPMEDLFYSSRNMTVVEKEMSQFNDQLKLLMSLHENIHTMLGVEEDKVEINKWIDTAQNNIFPKS